MVERVSVSPKRRIVRTFACRLAISSASITIPPWTRGAQEIPFLAAPLLSASDGRAVEFQERNFPLLGQGGVAAPSIRCSEGTFYGRGRGGWFNNRLFFDQHHPVCAYQRWLRSIFFMAQPPLLG